MIARCARCIHARFDCIVGTDSFAARRFLRSLAACRPSCVEYDIRTGVSRCADKLYGLHVQYDKAPERVYLPNWWRTPYTATWSASTVTNRLRWTTSIRPQLNHTVRRLARRLWIMPRRGSRGVPDARSARDRGRPRYTGLLGLPWRATAFAAPPIGRRSYTA